MAHVNFLEMPMSHVSAAYIPPCDMLILTNKAQPHDAMLYTRDGKFQTSCDTSKSHAICCDAPCNMLVILLPILEYLSYLLSDSQTGFSMIMSI